jgi:UDP-2-acetamido-2,6-beta-L-arabino-hexul-4-ose reductase
VPVENAAYDLRQYSDERGALAELLKSPWFGQVFVSRTKPGITRGNHFHHTKTEKFVVVEGDALIRLRPADGGSTTEISVRGTDFRVVDIPPGYAHSITNVGAGELVTLFWASEVFDRDRPDTFALQV